MVKGDFKIVMWKKEQIKEIHSKELHAIELSKKQIITDKHEGRYPLFEEVQIKS